MFKTSNEFKINNTQILIYGDAGVGKTTLAGTTNNALLMNFNKGVHRAGTKANLTIFDEDYKYIQEHKTEFVKGIEAFDTLIIDVVDDLLSQIVSYNETKNNYSRNKFKKYTDLKESFQNFFYSLPAKNVIWLAHAKEVDENDVKFKRPAIQGSTYDFLIGKVDFVGLYTLKNNKRFLSFNPTDYAVGKNSANMEDMYPTLENDYMQRIIDSSIESINVESEEQQRNTQLINQYSEIIQGVDTLEELEEIAKEITDLSNVVKVQLKPIYIKRKKEIE